MFSPDFLSKNIFRRILAMINTQSNRSLNKNDTSELISTPCGLGRYPNVSLHNRMKSILKDFYLFHKIKKMEISYLLVLFFKTEEAYSHGGLRTKELGQTPHC